MKKWLIISLMVLGIVLLPSSLHAPSTDGQVSAQSTPNPAIMATDTTVYTVATVYTTPDLQLEVPFRVESRWASDSAASPESTLARRDEPLARRGSTNPAELPGIWWDTNNGKKYFAIEDGKFISTDPTDTWFVYGWFGPLAAIKEDYNIKYPEWGNRHDGIDFAGRAGIDVIAASDGQVIFAGNKIGNTVIIRTGNYQITYGHLQDISVKVGERVTSGELIGHLGSTGTANPHLHFEVDHINGKARIAVNPVPLIDTDWSQVTIPDAPANNFYAGPQDPALQPNFSW
jgi:murein DD-endopeptidase MepM/ murein hydrolase activator NlpD